MSPDQKHILDRLKISGQLPTPKGVALQVIELTRQDDVSTQNLARVIGTDPALSQRVVKAANVLLGHVSRPVVTVHDAVSILGLRALRQLVLGIALVADYRHGPCGNFDYLRFWQHSLLTALAAHQLTKRSGLMAAEEIFVLGLLGQIGRLALATVHPQAYSDMLRQDEDGERLRESEWAGFGFDHAAVAAAMLADMHFPPLFQMLVHDYRTPQVGKADEGTREWQLLRTLHLAGLLADLLLAGEADRPRRISAVRRAAALLALKESDLLGMAETCRRESGEWFGLLGIGSPQIPGVSDLFAIAGEGGEQDGSRSFAPGPYDFKMRVLLVEDDRAIRSLLEQWLNAAGHRVSVAEDGASALKVAELHRPQVVIADWHAPRTDGIALSRELRRLPQHRNTYLIIVATDVSPDRQIEAFEAGVDDCLPKPLVPKLFFARLRAAQRVVQLQEELAFDREQLVRFSNELSTANRSLQRQALTDPLTDLPNRRSAMERLEQEWALTQRGSRALSCMMLDIDHFKGVNDRYGHQFGDEVLRLVADILRKKARVQDVVCRYGGEEFLVICPDSGAEAAHQAAERIRVSVQELDLLTADGKRVLITVSIGVAEKMPGMAGMDELINRADVNLYAAKAQGRNRTVVGT